MASKVLHRQCLPIYELTYTSLILYEFAGHSRNAPAKDYAVVGTPTTKIFGVFNSLVIIATTYGNGIIPEIQVCDFALLKAIVEFLVCQSCLLFFEQLGGFIFKLNLQPIPVI